MSPSVVPNVFIEPSISILAQSKQDVEEACSVLKSIIKSFSQEATKAQLPNLSTVAKSMLVSLAEAQEFEFARQVAVLRGIAEELAVYQVALSQRRAGSPLLEDLERADMMVQSFYSIVNDQKLELEQTTEPITVLYQSRLYSGAFDRPFPYIVGPLWSLNQAWNGIAYAHEVGHYVFHNVKGLADELLAKLMVHLGALGYSRQDLRVWGLWLGEIFADLFCLMRIGPAAIHSAQRLAFWAVPDPKAGSGDSDLFLKALLSGRDVYHPNSYLRVKLGLEAKTILDGGSESPVVQELAQRWESILTLVQGQEKRHVYLRMEDGSPNPLQADLDTLLNQGHTILELVLNVPLFALASTEAPNTLRAIREVFCLAAASAVPVDLKKMLIERAQTSNDWPAGIRNMIDKVKLSDIIAAVEFALDDVRPTDFRKLHAAALELTEIKRKQTELSTVAVPT